MEPKYIDYCLLEPVSSVEDFLKTEFKASSNKLKKHFKKTFLNRSLNAKNILSLPLNFTNDGEINPIYIGEPLEVIAEDEKYPFLKTDIAIESLKGKFELPKDSEWQTLYIAAGKKDKVNKIDIVGLLIKKGGLQKEDVGLIEVKDQTSYVAIKRKMVGKVLKALVNERIKNKKVKIEIAM